MIGREIRSFASISMKDGERKDQRRITMKMNDDESNSDNETDTNETKIGNWKSKTPLRIDIKLSKQEKAKGKQETDK